MRPELVAAIGLPCPYCGEPMTGPNRWPTRDHIKPVAHGGDGGPLNSAVVCEPCNSDKGSQSLRRFRNILRRRGDPRADRVHAFRDGHKRRLSELHLGHVRAYQRAQQRKATSMRL
jgi:5-methylcytosine-specific restriction endonuclease McrA